MYVFQTLLVAFSLSIFLFNDHFFDLTVSHPKDYCCPGLFDLNH